MAGIVLIPFLASLKTEWPESLPDTLKKMPPIRLYLYHTKPTSVYGSKDHFAVRALPIDTAVFSEWMTIIEIIEQSLLCPFTVYYVDLLYFNLHEGPQIYARDGQFFPPC